MWKIFHRLPYVKIIFILSLFLMSTINTIETIARLLSNDINSIQSPNFSMQLLKFQELNKWRARYECVVHQYRIDFQKCVDFTSNGNPLKWKISKTITKMYREPNSNSPSKSNLQEIAVTLLKLNQI